jgi:urease accessory protein
MHSEVRITATADRLPLLQCRGGLTARATLPDTVHLVSAAATPLGGDAISVRVIVEAGALLRLRSVAATVALPGLATRASRSEFVFEVAGCLDVDLEPTVVAADAVHETVVAAALVGAGEFRLRERVQIGRSGEHQGFWSGTLRVDVQGRPLLRHRLELGPGSSADDVLAAPRACISELRYPEGTFDAPGTLLQLADGGALATWQGRRLGPESSAGSFGGSSPDLCG